MTVKECYDAFGGNYEEALTRLMKDERIAKYLGKFRDATDYAQFLEALDKEQYEDAFRYMHNLKGVSLNLSMTRLGKESSELCEAFRGGKPTVDITDMLAAVKREYDTVIDAVSKLG